MCIGELIKKEREALGYSAEQLGLLLNISGQTVRNWEASRSTTFREEDLRTMCSYDTVVTYNFSENALSDTDNESKLRKLCEKAYKVEGNCYYFKMFNCEIGYLFGEISQKNRQLTDIKSAVILENSTIEMLIKQKKYMDMFLAYLQENEDKKEGGMDSLDAYIELTESYYDQFLFDKDFGTQNHNAEERYASLDDIIEYMCTSMFINHTFSMFGNHFSDLLKKYVTKKILVNRMKKELDSYREENKDKTEIIKQVCVIKEDHIRRGNNHLEVLRYDIFSEFFKVIEDCVPDMENDKVCSRIIDKIGPHYFKDMSGVEEDFY